MGETHSDETMFKVAVALREADLTEEQINDAINSMQNYGILFRERKTVEIVNMPPTLF